MGRLIFFVPRQWQRWNVFRRVFKVLHKAYIFLQFSAAEVERMRADRDRLINALDRWQDDIPRPI
jgi:hypothetical protein